MCQHYDSPNPFAVVLRTDAQMTLGLSTWKLLVIILYFPTLNLFIS